MAAGINAYAKRQTDPDNIVASGTMVNKPVGAIETALNSMEKEAAYLTEIVIGLQQTINPILSPERPTPAMDKAEANQVSETPLARRINDITN